jgi:hypothetical protein
MTDYLEQAEKAAERMDVGPSARGIASANALITLAEEIRKLRQLLQLQFEIENEGNVSYGEYGASLDKGD